MSEKYIKLYTKYKSMKKKMKNTYSNKENIKLQAMSQD